MTPDAPFPHLFTPLPLGSVTLPNRIVSSGHDTVMVHDGRITDRLVAYHRARAEGGVGLIIVQVAGVHETARYTSHVLMATDDSCIEGYTRLVDAVAPHGTVLFGQLFHPGREVMESGDGSLPVAVAPSAVPNERFHVMPRARDPRSGGDRRGLRGRGPPAAGGRTGRRGGRGQPWLPAVPIHEPRGQPPPRHLRRLRGEPPALPARHPGRGALGHRRRNGGGAPHLDRRTGPLGTAGRDRTRCLPGTGRPGTRRLPQRHHGHLGVAGRIGSHRAGDVDGQRLHGALVAPRRATSSGCPSSSVAA